MSAAPADTREAGREARVGLWLGLAAWLAFAAFHQGGGWHQNARFAGVRAIVEQGRLVVDDYAVFLGSRGPEGEPRLERAPVERGVVQVDGDRFALTWSGSGALLEPEARAEHRASLTRVAVSGDLAYAEGHLLPAKAPATIWLAVPAYFLLFQLESWLGLDPDAWWCLTLNAWLTGAGSVGLLAALGVVLFFRAACRLSPGSLRNAWLATLAFAFGTPYFPYATALFENSASASLLLAAFGCAFAARRAPPARAAALFGSGACAGLAMAASYPSALALPLLGVYALGRSDGRGLVAWAAGASAPLGLLGLQHAATLGSPFATPYAFNDPMFRQAGALLGVLEPPRPGRALALLLSPWRGLLLAAPVLWLAPLGWLALWRRSPGRREATLFAALGLVFLLFNASFVGWHGGWGYAPRYLIPALPFLALPLVCVAEQRPRWLAGFAGLSIAITTLITAVDPQAPVGSSPIALDPGRASWQHSPLLDYALPLFATGRATPLLPEGETPSGQAQPLAHFEGPVSANPIGMHEAWLGQAFALPGPTSRWNAFNLGELWLPGRRASLLVPGLAVAVVLVVAWRAAGAPVSRAGRGRRSGSQRLDQRA
jgi:hypothetical protein